MTIIHELDIDGVMLGAPEGTIQARTACGHRGEIVSRFNDRYLLTSSWGIFRLSRLKPFIDARNQACTTALDPTTCEMCLRNRAPR